MIKLDSNKKLGSSRFLKRKQLWSKYRYYSLLLILFLVTGSLLLDPGSTDINNRNNISIFSTNSTVELCPKVHPLSPKFNKSIDYILNDPLYKKQSIERLSKAVQIPTEVQDVNPDPKLDPGFYSQFITFHRFIDNTFPLIKSRLQKEVINEFGLLYTWKGTNETLKPILLMAHQDVVPVNKDSVDQWTFPPFSGHYDPNTDLLWGRGASDCKNLLIAELEAVEKLLEDGFIPERTIILSLGFDEESSGVWGASHLASFIHERYGDDSILLVVDEGGGIVEVEDGLYIAPVVNGEKGYVDVAIEILGHGGHSSAPPDHTTIGVAADLITLIESSPFPSDFQLDNPLYGTLTCTAEHSTSLPSDIKNIILNAGVDDKHRNQLTQYVSNNKQLRDLIRTTQSVDIISGGVKANALPESTKFLVNHRVDFHSSVRETVLEDVERARVVANRYGYGLLFEGEYLIEPTELGFIEVTYSGPLEPAPTSPSSGPVWDILVGTIQDLFNNAFIVEKADDNSNDRNNSSNSSSNNGLYITTGVFSGNTDTKYYWFLTNHIYRFIGALFNESSLKTIHSVNENIEMKNHLSAITFVYELIVNVNESDLSY